MCARAYVCVVIWTQAERRCEVVLGGVKGWREGGREGGGGIQAVPVRVGLVRVWECVWCST